MRILLALILLSAPIYAQLFGGGKDPRWQTVGAGVLASRPSTCTANKHVYICNGTGCTINGEPHYCTATDTWTVISGAGAGAGDVVAGAATTGQMTYWSNAGTKTVAGVDWPGPHFLTTRNATTSILNIAAGSIRVGHVVVAFSAATAQLTTNSGADTGYVYAASSGSELTLYIGINTGAITCTGCTAVTSITAFPEGSIPFYTWGATDLVWAASGTDKRVVLTRNVILNGDDIDSSTNATTGEQTLSARATLHRVADAQAGTALRCTDASTGSNDTYTCTMSPALAAATDKMEIVFTALTANTGAASLNAGPGAVAIKTCAGADPADNDIAAARPIRLTYIDTTTDYWQLPCNPQPVTGGGGGSGMGTFAAIPAASSVADGYIYLFTNSLYTAARSNASAWSYFYDGKRVIPPSIYGTWALKSCANYGTITNTHGYLTIAATGTAVQEATAMVDTALTSPFSIVVPIRMFSGDADGFWTMIGLVQTTGTGAGKYRIFGYRNVSGTRYIYKLGIDNACGNLDYGGLTTLEGLSISPATNLYLKAEDTHTGSEDGNITYSISSDGNTWIEVLSEDRKAGLVDARETLKLVFSIAATGSTIQKTRIHFLGVVSN